MVEHYDGVLLAIALLLVAGVLVGTLTPVPMQLARVVSVLAATPFVYDALFRNPPRPAKSAPNVTTAIVWHVVVVWAVIVVIR